MEPEENTIRQLFRDADEEDGEERKRDNSLFIIMFAFLIIIFILQMRMITRMA